MEPEVLPTLTAKCLHTEEMDSLSLPLLLLRGKTACLKEKPCMIVSIARVGNTTPLQEQMSSLHHLTALIDERDSKGRPHSAAS